MVPIPHYQTQSTFPPPPPPKLCSLDQGSPASAARATQVKLKFPPKLIWLIDVLEQNEGHPGKHGYQTALGTRPLDPPSKGICTQDQKKPPCQPNAQGPLTKQPTGSSPFLIALESQAAKPPREGCKPVCTWPEACAQSLHPAGPASRPQEPPAA